MADEGLVMEAGLPNEGMSLESDLVDEGLVMAAGLTDEDMLLDSEMVTRAW